MGQLLLHSGAKQVGRSDLEGLETPQHDRTWYPIPHLHLVNLVRDTMELAGIEIIGEEHALALNSARYFGIMRVRAGDLLNKWEVVIGLRNSHDKSFPAGLALGSHV